MMRLPGATPPGDYRTAQRVSYSPDGKLLAVCDSNEVKIYDASTGVLVRTLSGRQGDVVALAISRDGRIIATGSFDGNVRIWDAAAGALLHELMAHTQPLESLALSPDGRWLATGGDDLSLKIWDTATGDLVTDYHDFSALVDGVAFSPDGSRLAFTADTGLHVWSFEPDTGRGPAAITTAELFTLPGQVYAVFSPDGTQLATAQGSLAKLWDARTGKELLTFAGHSNWVMGIAFSPDGKQLASASMDETVRVWDIGPGKEVLALDAQCGSPTVRMDKGSQPAARYQSWDAKTGRLLLTRPVTIRKPGRGSAPTEQAGECELRCDRDRPRHASGKAELTLKGHEVGFVTRLQPRWTRHRTGA
jgi:WD40 repeat protein